MRLLHLASPIICAAALGIAHMSFADNHQESAKSQPYTWRNVRMGGAGFICGFVFHPAEPGLAYARTDMGGAYRRDSAEGEWIPLTDWLSYDELNLMGVESIAVDPSDPDRLYMACGTYTLAQVPDGAILRSADRGKSFEVIKIAAKFGGNETGRGNGERMSVDPLNGATILLGTRYDGLLRSDDYGSTWSRVTTFPDLMERSPDTLRPEERENWLRWQAGAGIIRIIHAPEESDSAFTSTVYALVSLMGQENLFVSHDGGAQWNAVPGQPTRLRPTDADLGPDGVLYLSYGTSPGPYHSVDGEVWRYDTKSGQWEDITPVRSGSIPDPEHTHFGYISVAIDPSHPGVVLATPFWFPGGEELFRSLDGGRTWESLIHRTASYDYTKIPYYKKPGIHWLFDVEIDPHNPDHCIYTTGFGGFETFNLRNADSAEGKTLWTPAAVGIEESVPLDMVCPSVGAPLISAIGDYGGFVHRDLDSYAPEGNFSNPGFGNTSGLAVAWQKQSVIVRVGHASKGENAAIGISADGGESWRPGVNPFEKARGGSVALAADASTLVWTPEHNKPCVSADLGESWALVESLPVGMRVVADTVNPLKFYALDIFARKLYRSVDGGRSFSAEHIELKGGLPVREIVRGDRRGGQDRVYPAFGREGDLWIASADGLYHAPDGVNFTRLAHVEAIHGFGFGKAAPGADYETLFIVGTVDGVRGIFLSDDMGESYVRINDDAHEWGLLLLVAGDMQTYGRVYVGTHGRGMIYGDIAEGGTEECGK
ncbi:MAG: hypothetical protein JW942_04340 [Opitutales bacterium]|nr:hypothetical protein [Opitutales bacterium]